MSVQVRSEHAGTAAMPMRVRSEHAGTAAMPVRVRPTLLRVRAASVTMRAMGLALCVLSTNSTPGCMAARADSSVVISNQAAIEAIIDHEIFVTVEAREPAVVDGIVVPRPLRPVRERPVRHAQVIVDVPGQTDPVLRVTDGSGFVHVPHDATRVTVLAAGNERWPITVRDCPMGGCRDDGAVYAWSARMADTVSIPVNSDVAGAFAIRDELVAGFRFVRTSVDVDLPPLTAQWRHGSNTTCNTSCFSGAASGGTIYVLALDDDTDEHDDDILRHEFGHYVEHVLAGRRSRGGYHDGSPTRPELAFSEGFCTWLATAIAADPIYVDTNLAGGGWTDYAAHHASADPMQPLRQDVSEDMVAELLWAWFDGRGRDAGPILQGLTDYVRHASVDDRGGRGVDLADALDGVVCDAPNEAPALISLASRHGWPWSPDVARCDGSPVPDSASGGGHPHESPITPSRISMEIHDKQGGVVLARVRVRPPFTAATLSWRDPDRALATVPAPIDLGALAAGTEVIMLADRMEGAPPDARVSVHLDGRLVAGARYHMTASIRADGRPWQDPPMLASNVQDHPLAGAGGHAGGAEIRVGQANVDPDSDGSP